MRKQMETDDTPAKKLAKLRALMEASGLKVTNLADKGVKSIGFVGGVPSKISADQSVLGKDEIAD
jgi:hypothetical protein